MTPVTKTAHLGLSRRTPIFVLSLIVLESVFFICFELNQFLAFLLKSRFCDRGRQKWWFRVLAIKKYAFLQDLPCKMATWIYYYPSEKVKPAQKIAIFLSKMNTFYISRLKCPANRKNTFFSFWTPLPCEIALFSVPNSNHIVFWDS